MNESQGRPGYQLARLIFRLLFRLLFRLDMQGMERIPASGPTMIAVNHVNVLEAVLFMAFSPRQPLSAFAKQEFQGTLAGRIVDVTNPIYVDRGEVDRAALKEIIRRLKAGEAFGVAPEGTRSGSGILAEGKEGVAYIASQTDAWIVPAALWGHEHFQQNLKRLRRPTIHVRVGEPFKLEAQPGQDRRERLAAGTDHIMLTIAQMLPPRYHGVYAEKVAALGTQAATPHSLDTP